jgi:hypothetical protein
MTTIRLPVILHAGTPAYVDLDPDALLSATGIPARLEAVERELRQHYHLAGGEPTSTGVAPGLQPEVDNLTPEMVAAIKEGCEQSRRGEVVERDFTAFAQPDADEARIEMHRGKGLVGKYIISKRDGRPVDPGAEYFVLRLDDGGGDPVHVAACRSSVLHYADRISGHLPKLASDLRAKYSTHELAQPDADDADSRNAFKDVIGEATEDELNHKQEWAIVDAILSAIRAGKVPGIRDMAFVDDGATEIAALRAQVSVLKASLDASRENGRKAQSEADMYERERNGIGRDLEQANAKRFAAEDERDQLKADLAAAKERAEKAEYERDVANKFIGHWSQECATARAERDAARAGLAEAVGVLRKAQRWASVSGPFDAADEAMWCRIDAILAKHPEAGAGEGK